MKKIITGGFLMALTLNLFATPNLIEKKDFESASIKNLYVELASENIEIFETAASDFGIEIYCNNKQYIPQVKVKDSTLSIIRQKQFNISLFRYSRCDIKLFIPQEKNFNEIEIETSSAEIDINTDLIAGKIKISSTSGEIESNSCLYADNIKIKSTSGDINVKNLDADDIAIESSSGEIELGSYTGGTGSLRTTSGEISCEAFAAEYANFDSNSGQITIKNLDCDYFDSETTSGAQYFVLKNAPIAKSNITSTSGSIDLTVPKSANFEIEVHSNSGSFKDGFSNNKFVPRQSFHEKINAGGAVINVSTTSGSIELDY